jgi:hypothetical protein
MKRVSPNEKREGNDTNKVQTNLETRVSKTRGTGKTTHVEVENAEQAHVEAKVGVNQRPLDDDDGRSGCKGGGCQSGGEERGGKHCEGVW